MQGQGRSKEGQRLVLLTASQSQVSTSNIVTASKLLFQLTTYSESAQHLKSEVEQSSRSKRETSTPNLERLV